MPDEGRMSLSRDEYLQMRARRDGVTPEEFLHRQRGHVVRIARSVLAGTTSVLAAARELSNLREIYPDDSDPDLLVLVSVDSQTDHLAIGDARRNWSASALARQDVEIEEAKRDVLDDVRRTCKRLVDRFDHADGSSTSESASS